MCSEFLARRDAQLLAHQVHARDHLGDRVLDLQARVHLEEEELAVLPEELDRSGTDVTDGSTCLEGDLAHRGARGLVDRRARRLLDQLLVAALDRAFALEVVHAVPVAIEHHLDLDVARVVQIALEIEATVAERGQRFARCGAERARHLVRFAHHADALASATCGRLDGDRIADALSVADGLLDVVDRILEARHGRHASLVHRAAALDLVAHHGDGTGRRTDPGEARVGHRLGELGVLGQESVAGVDGLGAGRLGCRQDLGLVEVALGRRRATERNGLVGHANVQRFVVDVRVDGDALDAHLAGGTDDAQGDLAPVRDQNSAEHQSTIREGCCRACASARAGASTPASRARESGTGASCWLRSRHR